jgi:hypothetical protein
MYSIFTYIWAIFWVNVGKYSIHGAYGNEHLVGSSSLQARFVQPPKKKVVHLLVSMIPPLDGFVVFFNGLNGLFLIYPCDSQSFSFGTNMGQNRTPFPLSRKRRIAWPPCRSLAEKKWTSAMLMGVNFNPHVHGFIFAWTNFHVFLQLQLWNAMDLCWV